MERSPLLILLLLTVVAVQPSQAPAQQSDTIRTLASFVEEALRANPGIAASKLTAASAAGRVAQSGAWENPQIGVEFFATPVSSANPFKDGMETDYFLQQMFPLSGKYGLMAEAASAGSRMADQKTVATERQIIADVTRAYAMLFVAQKRIELNTENVQLLTNIAAVALKQFGAGKAPQSDVLKAQIELAKAQNIGAGLEQESANAAGMLNSLKGIAPGSPIPPLAPLHPTPLTASEEELYAAALSHRAELQSMHEEIVMRRAELSAARREWVPDLMVRGMYKRMVMGPDLWSAMFSINIPFAPWSSDKLSGKVDEQEAILKAAEYTTSNMKNMILAEVREAWTTTSTRWQQLRRYELTILPQAQEAYASTLRGYQSGKEEFLSLLDSARMLQMVKMEHLMVFEDYVLAAALLERSIGMGLNNAQGRL